MVASREPGPRIACLMYHEVTDNPTVSGFQRPSARRYAHTPRRFEQHLARIAWGPCTPVRVDYIDPGRPGRHLLLTFDDGGLSAMRAAEALEQRGWRGHFFIVTSLVGSRTFLSADHVRQLHAAGHLIGSHSHTHPDILPDLSRPALLNEWRTSARLLEDLLGAPCLAASVPGGDLSRAVVDAAGDAGFRWLFTSEPWLEPRRTARGWLLGRHCLKAETPPWVVEQLIHFRGWRRAQLIRGVKLLARRVLAPVYRTYVAHTTRALPPITATHGSP